MELYETLEKLNIKYEQIEHPAVYTVEESKALQIKLQGIGCKNLFLTNKKGNYYLVLLPEDKRADLKEISKCAKTSRLSFAGEAELKQLLNLQRGSCTPLGIINDAENKVELIIDSELQNQKLLCHPNRNTATLSIEYQDLIKFIEYEKHRYIVEKL